MVMRSTIQENEEKKMKSPEDMKTRDSLSSCSEVETGSTQLQKRFAPLCHLRTMITITCKLESLNRLAASLNAPKARPWGDLPY